MDKSKAFKLGQICALLHALSPLSPKDIHSVFLNPATTLSYMLSARKRNVKARKEVTQWGDDCSPVPENAQVSFWGGFYKTVKDAPAKIATRAIKWDSVDFSRPNLAQELGVSPQVVSYQRKKRNK